MTTLAPISSKLARLLPRLASDRPGEVAAVAAAIGRQLAKVGADWHDLAEMLTMAPEAPLENQVEPAPIFTEYAAAVEWLLFEDRGELTARDRNFVTEMRGILRRWPPRPKQAAWIRALVDRLGGQFDG